MLATYKSETRYLCDQFHSIPLSNRHLPHDILDFHDPSWIEEKQLTGTNGFYNSLPPNKHLNETMLFRREFPHSIGTICFWLVVSAPLKNMSSSVGLILPNTWKKSCSKPPI
jgi:hypothetical protein